MNVHLVFVRYVGETFEKNRIYEFLFSEDPEKTFEIGWLRHNWDSQPSNERPEPFKDTIVCVGTLVSDTLKFGIVTESMEFDMLDCKEGVVALAWEETAGYSEQEYPEARMVFPYGMEKQKFDALLYNRETNIKYK